MQSDSVAKLADALAKAQAVMKAATINKTNPHFKNRYADLAAVLEAIRKPLSDNGLSITQTTEVRDGGFVLVTTLRHSSGEWISSEYPLPVAAKPQELGSALTYARRYSLSAMACIAADEDDDAEGARQQGQTAAPVSPRNSKPNAVKPQTVEAPVDPQTGEVSPHKITAADHITWGSMFVAAVDMAASSSEIDQWLNDNSDALSTLEGAAPKVHARVMARVNDKIKTFSKEAA